MRIGYYIHHSSLKAGGIFTYSIGILKLLLASDDIEKIIIVIDEGQKDYFEKFSSNSKVEITIIDRSRILVKARLALSYLLIDNYTFYNKSSIANSKLQILKNLAFFINPYKKVLNRKKIDLFHVPLQYSPIYGGDVPIITTMHDLQELHFPENFDEHERLHRGLNNKKAITNSDHILVSFEHIRNDLLKYFNVTDKKISVCPPPFTKNWFSTTNETDKDILIRKYNLGDRIILYPAATWKHKNHINLIKAVAALRDEGIFVQLICTGNKTEYYEILTKQINESGLSDQTKFLGIVSEEDLIGLYKYTSIVVIPTFYEAGSGPLYEAMRYSAPVICSNVTSLPETMGNDEFLFDPQNATEISNLINKMLTDENFRQKNISNSIDRMNYFKSQNYVDNFLKVYQTLK